MGTAALGCPASSQAHSRTPRRRHPVSARIRQSRRIPQTCRIFFAATLGKGTASAVPPEDHKDTGFSP